MKQEDFEKLKEGDTVYYWTDKLSDNKGHFKLFQATVFEWLIKSKETLKIRIGNDLFWVNAKDIDVIPLQFPMPKPKVIPPIEEEPMFTGYDTSYLENEKAKVIPLKTEKVLNKEFALEILEKARKQVEAGNIKDIVVLTVDTEGNFKQSHICESKYAFVGYLYELMNSVLDK